MFVCHCWNLSCQISRESVRLIYSLNTLIQCYILSLTQYCNNLHIYCAIISWKFMWNIQHNNGVYCDLPKKGAYLNTVKGEFFPDILNYIEIRCLSRQRLAAWCLHRYCLLMRANLIFDIWATVHFLIQITFKSDYSGSRYVRVYTLINKSCRKVLWRHS